MAQNVIPVFFTVDEGYIPFLAAALCSAVENSSPDRNYKAIILHEDVSEESQKRIKSLAGDNFEVEFVPMTEGLETITDRMSNRLRCDYFTLTIYFRLFIPTMFPEYDKAIYIDSDVVVPGDLAELYDTDLGDNFIGACFDHSIEDVPELVNYTVNAVGVPKGEYINSGVLLMNTKKLREAELDRHFLSLLNTYHFDSVAPDQDYLNAMCCGKIYYLDENWDAMPNDQKPPKENPKLVHYNLFSKPWCNDGIQYEEYFWKYAKDCGFLPEIEKYKANYSDEQRAADAATMGLLVRRGCEITESEVTFKKMFEDGVKIRL